MKLSTRLYLCFFLSICIVAACRPAPQVPVRTIAQEPVKDSTLEPGDEFDVRVFEEEGLSQTYSIATDGSIDFPLLGNVMVAGLTPTEITNLLEKKLVEGDLLKNPHISILVKKYKSKKVSVFGEVREPGTFPYQEGMTVVEAISTAGGFTSMAKTNDTTVTRVVDGKKIKYRVPVEEIGEGQVSNFVMSPGDIVYVPQRVF